MTEEMYDGEEGRPAKDWNAAVLIVGFLALLGFLLVPKLLRVRAEGLASDCLSNLRRLSDACEPAAATAAARSFFASSTTTSAKGASLKDVVRRVASGLVAFATRARCRSGRRAQRWPGRPR